MDDSYHHCPRFSSGKESSYCKESFPLQHEKETYKTASYKAL